MPKLSDLGQELRVVPATEMDVAFHFGEGMPPHFHFSELRRMYAQVVACVGCGFWLPIGACCPQCGRHGRHS